MSYLIILNYIYLNFLDNNNHSKNKSKFLIILFSFFFFTLFIAFRYEIEVFGLLIKLIMILLLKEICFIV